MNIKVEFLGEKIILYTENDPHEYALGTITCMMAEGEWKALLNFLDIERNYKKLETYARNFLDKCFYSKSRTNKIKGYVLCDSELELHNKKYTVYKNVSGRMPYGKMIVSDTYQIQSPIDLINLEMLYAVTHDMTITKCKNCGKYFVARNAGAQYCDRVFMAERTCRQLGAKKSFNENLKLDVALLLYEKTYQATYYKTRKAKSQKELNALGARLDELKNWRVKYKNGEVTEQEFVEFLKR